ncbi:336_t:CDS:2 [Ambispora leptoticha]|uniref:336_t:CDS:1 n=1 Tax=Ambispora leptoticha TaxID=144679 RepID=A0A9N9FL63_9GLOM|nr:336_t:CDS:2 [Ambispora leptoticha]
MEKISVTNLETSFKKCTIECYSSSSSSLPKIRLAPQLRQDLYKKFESILDSYDAPQKSIEKLESWLKEKNLKSEQLFSMLSAGYSTENTNIPYSAMILGFMYEHGIGTEKNLALAFKYYKVWYDAAISLPSSSVASSSHALNIMGIFYRDGIGIDRDPRMAFELFQKGAALEHLAAQYHLSLCFRDGIGTTVDFPSHSYWLYKAATSGYTPAQLQLANFLRDDVKDSNHKEAAYTHFLTAAVSGSKEAALYLADAYQDGLGTKRDEASSLRWYKVAAKNGNLTALNKLGHAYHRGSGVKRNHYKAFRYFVQYSERAEREEEDMTNIGISQYVLGNCYHYGWGVTKDLHMASKWYRKAIDNGNRNARVQFLLYFMDSGKK